MAQGVTEVKAQVWEECVKVEVCWNKTSIGAEVILADCFTESHPHALQCWRGIANLGGGRNTLIISTTPPTRILRRKKSWRTLGWALSSLGSCSLGLSNNSVVAGDSSQAPQGSRCSRAVWVAFGVADRCDDSPFQEVGP